MEILFEYRGSRRQLDVAEKESITRVVSNEMRRIGKPRAQVFTANDDLPSSGGGGQRPDIYLLQRWSNQWDCYVDVGHCNEVIDGDKLAVIAKPKPPSMLSLLCCCGSDSSYRGGKVGGSGKTKIPKTEEIQSLEYRFRAESEAGSVLEESSTVQNENDINATLNEGEQYIRAQSGRAAWKLVENSATTQDGGIPSPPAGSEEQQELEAHEEEGSEGQEEEEIGEVGEIEEEKREGGEECKGEEDGDKEESGGEEEVENEGRKEERENEGRDEGVEEEEVATSQEDGHDDVKTASESSVPPTIGAMEGTSVLDSVKDPDIESNEEKDSVSPQAQNETMQSQDDASLTHDDNEPMDDTSQSHDENAVATDIIESHDGNEEESTGGADGERVEDSSDKKEADDDGNVDAEEPVNELV